MNTLDFIRHHTRIILREAGEGKGSSSKGSSSPASDSESGDFRGKYSSAVRGGRASKAARAAEGLAKSNPQQLLANLGMATYTTAGNDRLDEIFNFIKKFRSATPQVSIAFESPEKKSGGIDIPVAELDKSTSAVSQFQAARYVRAALIAGFMVGIIDFDPTVGGNKVQTRKVEGATGDKYFVRVTLSE